VTKDEQDANHVYYLSVDCKCRSVRW